MAIFSTSLQQMSAFISSSKLSFVKVKFIPCFDNTSHDTRGNPQSKPSAGEKKLKFPQPNPKPDRNHHQLERDRQGHGSNRVETNDQVSIAPAR
jgi:hypothetical protein